MNKLDQISDSVNTEAIAQPAIGDADTDFTIFYSELPFWGIQSFRRKVIYSLINGVCAAELIPKIAADVFKRLQPVGEILFPFLEQIEEYYEQELAVRHSRHQRVQALAVAVHQTLLSDRLGLVRMKDSIDEQSWCAFAFCVGALARQRGSIIAKHKIEKYNSRYDHAESYLFAYVAARKCKHYYHSAKDPMLRFLAACYPTTPMEADAICETFVKVYQSQAKSGTSINLTEYFDQFHLEGIRWATEEPERVVVLINDIETNISKGIAKENVRLFKEYIGEDPSSWTLPQVRIGIKALVAKQQRHIIDGKASEVKRIHDLALLQRMLDGAFWSGLYIGGPEAFNV
jgi:uncharacterized protein YktA (UPF0223 family)